MHTSYSQNSEDIILWRSLKSVSSGFYVDVGANDPDTDSVTRHFYEHGWRGINIEPLPSWHKILNSRRPRDINLQVAAGSNNGEIEIYETRDSRLSTTLRETALRHTITQGADCIKHKVKVITLNSILEEFKTEQIHFLKIDVEGGEEDVLKGINLNKFKPWIILVESTLPGTSTENYSSWEHIILSSGYSFVYFDGLNRFYISNEHRDLKSNFNLPPYIGDGFITHGQRRAEDEAFNLKDRISRMERSLSWKVSAPLRWIHSFIRL